MKRAKNNKYKTLQTGLKSIDLPTLIIRLCDEINYKESFIIGLKNSLSWKITLPCRFIDELIRKLAFKKRKVKTDNNITFKSESSELLNLAKSYLESHFNKIIYNSDVVCFDVSVLINNDAGTGIQRVVREIATNIAKLENKNLVLVDFSKDFPVDVTSYFKSETKTDHFYKNQLEYGKIVFLDSSWNILEEKQEFFKNAKNSGVEFVTIVYDIFPLSNPELCELNTVKAYKQWFNRVIEITNTFICISKATKTSLVKYINSQIFSMPGKEIIYDHWHLGCDLKINSQHNIDYNQRHYLLMVSTVEPRKNYEFVIDTITKMWDEGELEEDLVIVGREGWNSNNVFLKLRNHTEYGKKLKWYSEGITDGQLDALYSASLGLIQASLNEGFGLAVVEASRYAKPIVLSDIPVFREIITNNGYFFELGSEQSFRDAILKAVNENALPTGAIKKSWKESTTDLLSAINKNRVLGS